MVVSTLVCLENGDIFFLGGPYACQRVILRSLSDWSISPGSLTGSLIGPLVGCTWDSQGSHLHIVVWGCLYSCSTWIIFDAYFDYWLLSWYHLGIVAVHYFGIWLMCVSFDYYLVVSVRLTPFRFSGCFLFKVKLNSVAWVRPAEIMSLEDSSLKHYKISRHLVQTMLLEGYVSLKYI